MRTVSAVLCAAFIGLVASACSSVPTRNSRNFCRRYEMDKAAYISKYGAESARIKSAADPLTGLLGATAMSYQALGSMVDMFDDLSTVAPDKIERQVIAVRDSLKSEEDTLKGENPASGGSILTTLLGSLETGLESQQDWGDVGAYLTNVCHTN